MSINNFFNQNSLANFVTAQGKTLLKVSCYLWQNNFSEHNTFEIIDAVELNFTDGEKLIISCNEDGDGLEAATYEPKKVAKQLREEFDGKIKLMIVNASETKMWKDVIDKKLIRVKLTSNEEKNYLADAMILDFGEERRELKIGPEDGIIVDFYEE